MTKATKAHLMGTSSHTAADPLKADFRNFLWMVWQHLGLPKPTPVQYDIAQFLQKGPRRSVIEAFRGVGKSWVTSAFVCWLLYCNPQLKIMVVSASKNRADDFSTFTLRLINDIELLNFLRPRDDQRSSKIAFDVGPAKPDHSPSVKSVGITGQLTGSRADYIIADDIEVVGNSATQALRDKLGELVKEFDAVLKPGGRVIYLGTPQCEQSLYNSLPERGYVVRIWPARYPTADKREKYGAKLAPFIANILDKHPHLEGHSTDPDRFSDEDLMEREMSYGRSGFALQFQLDTSLSDADRYPLRLRDLVVLPLDPLRAPSDLAWAAGPDQIFDEVPAVGLNGDHYHRPIFVSKEYLEYEGSVMFVDPSGRGKDETTYAVVKMLHGRLFLTDIGAFLGGYDEKTLTSICMAARRQHVNLILCEPNYGGGMFTQLLGAVAMKTYPVEVKDAEWAKVQKEMRIIDTLEPIMNQHRLVVCPSVIEKDYRSTESYTAENQQGYRLFYQMTRITRDRGALKHDDRLDAVAGAVAHWAEYMNRDIEQAHLQHKEALIDAELEKFMSQVIGGPDRFGGGGERFASSIMSGRRR
ncbi:phage terminase large subunit [Bradyrhizobium sp. CCGB20]|uniref:phage terminase large subunit n=1 Tax=Bradyrhizobium sp. CCGB20 TaxID=2949633 RepID=UPI0020B1C043|nr:phage terminase large subunit [Bradyrhizobium sp. CCGB20]MCP3400397.1 phage terminase large subunit [Bradyrhizobium sp. CCGB20]